MVNEKKLPALHITKIFNRKWQREKILQGLKKDTTKDVEE